MKSNLSIIITSVLIIFLLGFLIVKSISRFQKPFSIAVDKTTEGIAIQIKNAVSSEDKKPVCEIHSLIEMKVAGENGELLKLFTNCQMKTSTEVKDLLIPFKHILSFAPQSAEFTTDIYTKIYVSNHQKEWSKKWKIESVEFFTPNQERLSQGGDDAILDSSSFQSPK